MESQRHSLADELAIERTRLANERTLLAYVRTGLAIVAGGFGLAELVPRTSTVAIGVGLMVVGAATVAFGVWRFVQAKRELEQSAARASGADTLRPGREVSDDEARVRLRRPAR